MKVTYLLTYTKFLSQNKKSFEHLFPESVTVLVSDFSLYNLTFRDFKDSFFTDNLVLSKFLLYLDITDFFETERHLCTLKPR